MKKFFLAFLVMLCSWMSAKGYADRANYEFYGWSPDGHYLAFAQHGFGGDGDETAYTELFIIDSQKNSMIKRYYKLADQPGEGRIGIINALAVYKQAEPLFKKLGITDKRLGTVVWQSKVPDKNIPPDPTSPDVFPKKILGRPNMVPAKYFSAMNEQWQFRLAQIPYGTKAYDCPPLANYTRGFLLEVTSQINAKSVVTTRLQEDVSRVPKSRACTFYYEPVEVRVQGDYISVALAIYRASGFEDFIERKFIVVTGVKPKKVP